jgi:WD40 repeat protein/class 3 adenylate cyclase
LGEGAAFRTFLIADIRGYTSFTGTYGDEAAARLAKSFADLARDAVEARSGSVIELRGDEALAVFTSPSQAVRAAIEFQAACREEATADPTLPLLVGIGIDAGEAVPVEDGFRGAALNTAARLCSKATAGEVLITEGAAELARDVDGIRFEGWGTAELKGFERPVELLRAVALDGRRSGSPADPSTREDARDVAFEPLPPELDPTTPIVDRERESHWLRGTWRQAQRGKGRLVFVSGPAGIGKTRLIAELAGWVHDRSGRVRYAGAGGAGTALALGELRDVERATVPTLLVVNDLDALDDAVVDALDAAAASILDRPVMIVGAFRELSGLPTLASLVGAADERGDGHRTLAPLDPAGVADIVRMYAGADVDDAPVESMWRASGGVPGRVHEVASAWARDEAARRLTAAAEWLAEGRTTQAGNLEFANNVISLRLGRLYDVDGAASPGHDVCPYKGLAAFEVGDAAYFFGRERLVGELSARTVGVGMLGVVGASGSGKSSVVSAGLVPSLAAGLLPGSERWRAMLLRPGDRPVQALRSALASVGLGADGNVDLALAAENLGPEGRLALIVDQFEELFTTTADGRERDAFVASLVGGAEADVDRVLVIITIRADYYGHCAQYPELARLLAANHVLLGTMTADELRRAIELPARRVGLRVESTLSQALVDEVTDEPGGLPLLSTVLVELWESRERGWLRMEAYERSGGLRGAVARLAERSYQQLTEPMRATAKTALLRLVGSGEGEAAVRRPVPISEFDLDRNEAMATVLDRLTRDRLLIRNDDVIEIAHEALIREWPRLRGWLEEDAQGRLVRAHLTDAAKRWLAADRDPAELYRGARLSVALDRAATHPDEINELERSFLDESRLASEREAERQRRANRRLRGLLAGVAMLLVLALLAGGIALVQRGRARQSAATANRQAAIARSRELASSAISVLDEDPELTILLTNEAKRAAPGEELPARLVSALHDAVRSTRTVMSRGWDPELPLTQIDGVISPDASLVAVTGRKETIQAWDAATGDVVWELKDDAAAGWFSHPRFSPDGSVLAVAFNRYWTERQRVEGGQATGIYLVDPRSGETVERIPPSTACDWIGVPSGSAFTPDGARLVTVVDPPPCRDGELRLDVVDLDTGTIVNRFAVASSPQVENDGPRPLLFVGIDDTHGRLLMSDGDDLIGLSAATTRMIDLSSGDVLWKRPNVNGFLSPDGSIVALSAPDPTQRSVELVDPATGENLTFLTGQKAGTSDVAFSYDGRVAYTAGLDGTSRVWDTATGSNRITLTGQGQGLLGVSVDDAAARAATFGRDGTVRVWDLTAEPLGETMALDLAPGQIGTRAIDATDGIAAVVALRGRATVYVLDPSTGELVRRFPDHAGQVLAIDADRRAVMYQRIEDGPGDATVPDVGSIVVRDAPTGAILKEFEGLCPYSSLDPSTACPVPPDRPYGEWVYGMSVTPDGRVAAAGGQSLAASVWDVETGSVLATLGPFEQPGSGGAVTSVAIHPDGSAAAVRIISAEPRVAVVDLDGTTLAEFPFDPPATSAGHIAFSPDGTLLAAGGNQLEVFDTASWGTRWRSHAHDGGVFHLDVSPSGRSIVTTGPDGFVRLWSAEDGSLLHAISLGDDYGKAVAFTDDRHVVVGTQEGLVTGLTFDVDELLEIGMSRVTRTLTEQECRTYLQSTQCP